MSFDTLHYLLLLRPLIVFLVACPFLVLAVLVGGYTQRRHAKRTRETEAGRVLTAVRGLGHRPDQVTASETLAHWRAEVRPRHLGRGTGVAELESTRRLILGDRW